MSVPPIELGLWALVPTGNKIESVEFICSFAPRTAVADVAELPIITWSYVALGFAQINVLSLTPLIIVSPPATCVLFKVVALPKNTLAEAPMPPTTTNAPVVVLELSVPLAATKLPLLVNIPEVVAVVNAPVPGVTLPIACACNPPVVAVLKVVAPVTPTVELNVPVVNAPVLAELAPIGAPLTLPPVITALPVLKLVATNVATCEFVIPVTDPPVI